MKKRDNLFNAHRFAVQLAARRRAQRKTADGLRVSEAHDPSAAGGDRHYAGGRVHGTPVRTMAQIEGATND